MPYTTPTSDQFYEKFPEFEDIDDAKIDAAIAEAPVDETWMEADYQPAILYYAAHIISVGEAGAAAFGQDDLKSISIGPLSLSYGGKLSASDFNTTSYGQFYLSIRARNVPAIAVV